MQAQFPLRVAAAILVIGGSVAGTAGCGSSAGEDVDPATAACRSTWRSLEDTLVGRDTAKTPSRLPERWAAILAGVRYHVTTGSASDCGKPLRAQRKAIARLNAFERKVEDYDMELAHDQLAGVVRIYVRSPLPSRAVLGSTGAPIPHARAKQALDTLGKHAARADKDLADAWAEISSIDISDKSAVDKVVSDLKFLAGRSAAFGKCAAAMKVLRQVVRQQFAALSGAATPSATASGSSGTPNPSGKPSTASSSPTASGSGG